MTTRNFTPRSAAKTSAIQPKFASIARQSTSMPMVTKKRPSSTSRNGFM
jgi:hypothetical protein